MIALGYSFYFMYKAGLSIAFVSVIALYSVSALFNTLLFAQTRNPSTKMAWLMFMTLVPVFGHIIFIIFGKRYRGRASREKYLQKKTFKHEKIANKKSDLEVIKRQTTVSKRGIYDADIELLNNGHDGLERLFEDLEKAKSFIHVNYYIIKPGEIYEQFKAILLKKVKEGVEVRFIVDDFGRWAMPWYEIRDLRKHGIQIEIFGKVFFPFVGSENGYRSHRKIVIIDGERVHTGGINIANEYANIDKLFGRWLDYQVIISGEAVKSYSLLFLDDWKLVTTRTLSPEKYVKDTKGGSSRSLLVEDSPEVVEPILEDSIVSWILSAKKSITLSTPYFVPSEKIISALKFSAMAGVDIKVYIPGKPDKKTVLIVSRYRAAELSKYGIKFMETKDILVHSKIGVFDDEYAYIGTANIDLRSLYSQFEFVNLVQGPIVKDVKELLNSYEAYSVPVDLNRYTKFWPKKIMIRMGVLIFSPLM